MLARATEGTAAPTPGYLYADLAKGCLANPSACADTARYLTGRLASKSNPHIKTKCLKVMAKLCESVRSFGRTVSQDPRGVSAIKEAIGFRGNPDPVHGDTYNEAVRTAARECLEAVYTERNDYNSAGSSSGAMTGIGSAGGGGYQPQQQQQQQHYSQPAGAYNGQPSRMQGIGNPMYANQPHHSHGSAGGAGAGKGIGVLKEAGEVIVGMIRDPLARNTDAGMQPPRHGHSELPGYSGPQYGGSPPPGQQQLSQQTGGQWNMATNRGPTAIQNDEYYKAAKQTPNYQWAANGGNGSSATAGQVGGSWASASAAPAPSWGSPQPAYTGATAAPSAPAPVTQSDGSYERQLILELCPPGGMKPVPPPDKLENFKRAVPSLNADLICPVILDCIEDGQPWVIRAKALGVMEVAVAHSPACLSFMQHNADEIAPLGSHSRPAVRDPARRVLELLGVPSNGAHAAAPVAAAAAPQADLLGFDEPAPPVQAPPAQAPAPASDMFGGMQVKNKAPAPPQVAPVPPPAAAPSLLDFEAAPAPSSAAPDVFAAAPAPAVSTAAPIDSMFGGMTLKEDSAAAAAPVAASKEEAGPASSAFGFINDSKPAPAPAAPVVPQAKLTPNTQRKMMQVSPEQLQAMAVQQANMQQAQQMQLLLQQQQQMMANPLLQQQLLMQQQQQMRMNGPRLTLQQQQQPPVQNRYEKKFDFVKDVKDSMK